MIDCIHTVESVKQLLTNNSLASGKPILLVGSDADRQEVFDHLVADLDIIPVSLGLELSQSLMGPTSMRLDLPGEINALGQPGTVILLDRIQILMLPQLRVNAIDVLCHVARRRSTCVSWPGRFEGGRLKYANQNHPECLDEDASRVLVIDLNDEGTDR